MNHVYVCMCQCQRGPQYPLTESSCQPTMCVYEWRCPTVKCCLYCRSMEEKHRSVKNLPADISKANPGSQKAVPVNAWLLAQGSHKRQKSLLIKPQQAKLQRSWQASKTNMLAGRPSISQMHNNEGCQLKRTQRNYHRPRQPQGAQREFLG